MRRDGVRCRRLEGAWDGRIGTIKKGCKSLPRVVEQDYYAVEPPLLPSEPGRPDLLGIWTAQEPFFLLLGIG